MSNATGTTILSDVFFRPRSLRDSSLCWIEQEEATSAENSACSSSFRCLTYQHAAACLVQHTRRLYRILAEDFDHHNVTLVYLCNNSIDFALSVIAAAHVAAYDTLRSCRPALLNTRWSIADMTVALQHCQSVLLIYDANVWNETANLLSRVLQKQNRHVTALPLPSIAADALRQTNHEATIPSDRTYQSATNMTNMPLNTCTPQQIADSAYSTDALIVFTSGTTATAKGVRLSHRALLVQAAAKCQSPCAYSKNTRMLGDTVPLFHVGGLSSWLAVWMAGGAIVTTTRSTPKTFSARRVYDALCHSAVPVNTLVVVPAMVHALHQQAAFHNTAVYSQVELILVGGQALLESQANFLRATFPRARIVQTYACSEAASSLTFWDVTRARDIVLSERAAPGVCVGQPPPHIQLGLVSETTHEPLTEPYQVGLLTTRGPHMMNGYWNSPKIFAEDSWYRTSDLMFRDDSNRWFFCGRQTDTIRTGGETVWASQVEAIIGQHQYVLEVAVLGLPDERLGETVACAMVFRKGTEVVSEQLRIKELQAWCQKQGLASYKMPRRWVFLDSLPRNTSGKVLKHQLRPCFEDLPGSRL